MQVELPSVGMRFLSKVIGVDREKAVIVDSPLYTFDEDTLESIIGNDAIVRFEKKGNKFGFRSKVLNAEFGELQYLFLEYPLTMEVYQARKEPRFDAMIPAVMIVLGLTGSDLDDLIISKGERFKGTVVNISMTGCCFVIETQKYPTAPEIDIDAMIVLEMRYRESEEKTLTMAKIKNIRKDSNEISLGLMFSDISGEFTDGLVSYIALLDEIRSSQEGDDSVASDDPDV